MHNIFQALYTDGSAATFPDFILIVLTALALGLAFALLYQKKESCSRGFALALSLLPAVVATVILMVNGSIGAGVAVAGTFSLVRFRSAPGTAKEILSVFIAMAAGLTCGMGLPFLAAVFTAAICLAWVLISGFIFPDRAEEELDKTLQITIPEDLEYADLFDDIFERYATRARLVRVRTTNLGSLNRLSYDIRLKQPGQEKAMIDELRCRNGNLEINLAARAAESEL